MSDSEKDAAAKTAAKAKHDNEKAEEAREKSAKKPAYIVAKGKAITSKKGVLVDGAEIKVEDLSGNKEAFDAFITSGHIIKNY